MVQEAAEPGPAQQTQEISGSEVDERRRPDCQHRVFMVAGVIGVSCAWRVTDVHSLTVGGLPFTFLLSLLALPSLLT